MAFTDATAPSPTNWAEVISQEMRAWWEVLNPPVARNPDPIFVIPPPLISQPPFSGGTSGGVTFGTGAQATTISTPALVLIGLLVVIVLMNQ